MPAKDNDPTAPTSPPTTPAKTPARKPVRKAANQTAQTASDAEVPASAASARRRRAPVETAMAGTKTAAPKRRRASSPSSPAADAAAAPAVDGGSSLDGAVNLAAKPADTTPDDATRSVEEEVRLRAYLIFAARGHRAGSADADWLQAEHEVLRARGR